MNEMSSTNSGVTSSPLCEWLFELIIPNLYNRIKMDGHQNLLNFIVKLNEFNHLMQKLNLTNFAMNTFHKLMHCQHQFGLGGGVGGGGGGTHGNEAAMCTSSLINETRTTLMNSLSSTDAQHESILKSFFSSPTSSSSSSSSSHSHFSNFNSNNKNNDHMLMTATMNNYYLVNYTADLYVLMNYCQQMESNIVYIDWLFNIFRPLITTLFLTLFLLPAIIVIFLYGLSLFCFLSKHWNKLKAAFNSNDIWQASYKSIAVFWETTGAIWHGHEIIGLENLPDSGPALLIYYHAAMPIDFYYVHSKVVLYKNRRMKIVADRFLFKVPGLSSLLEAFEVTPGSLDSCVSLLNEGHILAISPGGVREALFSDHNYEIIWGKRCGFAKVAHDAKVPVIPMFTQNCREALRTLPFFRKFFRFIYEKTRLPLVPIYGLFPVKLRTYIGEPIEYDANRTSEELKELTQKKLDELIKRHQRLPGSIFQALLDRFRRNKKND